MKSGRCSLPDFLFTSNGVEEMVNEKNLIPMNERTEEEQREIARKGGIASGASRRAYRSLKQAAKAFFKENDDAAMRMIQALYEEAEKGNVKAIDKLQDLIGETVQREELALKKKQFAQQNGQKSVAELPQLLQALQEDDAE
jgi:hypothetical protein